MKLLIDDANIEKIRKIYEFYSIDGVTTNPSLMLQMKTVLPKWKIFQQVNTM